ncbi:MAG TPA: hypothetical protein VFX28_23365 [Methylomirabilota bacterium]|nr:hypothetical protein [Methylomirabilota bacterium]
MRSLALAAGLALSAGCTAGFDVNGTEWARPATGFAQVTWDEVLCARVAADAGRTPPSVVGGLADVPRSWLEEAQREAAFARCMADKGYRRA